MKNKKILSIFIVLLFAVLLVACKKDTAKEPVFTGVADKTIEVGDEFNPMTGVVATDEKDGDITNKVEVTGTVDTTKVGVTELTYKVTNSAKLTAEAKRKITVVEGRLYANGEKNFKFAGSDLRHTFFGAAEKYLLDNVYGGVPLFENSGLSIYSDRVSLPVTEYVPVMGWGVSTATLTKDDSTVSFTGQSGKGETGKYTYRGTFSSNPTTFNQWISDDSVSSDATGYMLGSLYAFEFNGNKTGYEVNPSMAGADPIRLGGLETIGDTEVATKWEVPIKEGLKWGFHPDTDTTGLAEEITAQTFVDTYKFAIDSGWFRARAGGSHFWAQTSPVKGAKEYYDKVSKGVTADFKDVGLSVSENGKSIIFEFDAPLSEWNLKYWLTSDTMTPVHLDLLKKVGEKTYGTSPTTMAYTGAYYLDNYEPDKVLEYKKNANFHSPDKYNFDGYHFSIIERAEIIFAEFEAGHLDGSGVPLTKYGQYKDNPGVKRTPGTTTFRMNINGVGSTAAQRELFPDSVWNPTPILANTDFRKALYFGVDRETLAWDVLKTSDPGMHLFSKAYLVDPQTGTSFRDTEQGKAVDNGLSAETHGYAPDAAKDLFNKSVAAEISAGRLKSGDTIKLEIAVQAGSTAQQQLGDFVKASYESLFNKESHGVKVEFTVVPVAFPDIYYTKQLIGEFDLGMGGISGSSLNAAGFLEVFSSDNRGGFTLNWGFDTSVAEIPVTYTDLDGTEVVDEYWSFDAIVTVLNGTVNLVRGVEATPVPPTYETEIAAAIAAINKIPATAANTEKYIEAVEAAGDAVAAVPAAFQSKITNLDKYTAAAKIVAVYENTNAIVELNTRIADLPALNDLTLKDDLGEVLELLDLLGSVKASKEEPVVGEDKLVASFEKLVELNLEELATGMAATAASDKAVTEAKDLVDTLVGLYDPKEVGYKAKVEALYEAVVALDLAQAWAFVDAIPAEADLTHEDATKVKAARAAVAAYFAKQDDLTPANAYRLLPILEEIADMVAVVDAADIVVVNLLILTLPNENDVKLVDQFDVAAVRAEVRALRARVDGDVVLTNEKYLEDAEDALVPLKAKDDALNFYWLAQVLPDANDASELNVVQVKAARDAYNALSKEAKAIVDDAEALKALVDALPEDNKPANHKFQDPVQILEDLEDVLDLK